MRQPLAQLVSTQTGFDTPETVVVETHRVWCDGPEGGGPLGHPRVYLEMGAEHSVDCPYCDRRFTLGGHAHDESQRRDPADYEGARGN